MANPAMSQAIKDRAIAAFNQAGGNVTRAADLLGIPRGTFNNQLRRAREIKPSPEFKSPFSHISLPSADEPLSELLERKRSLASRVLEADAARTLVQVNLRMSGPVGLFLMGDPHIDNDGCDLPAMERDLRLVSRQPRIMGLNIGDVTDNWVGRLERLYAQSSTKAADAWRLAEYLFSDEFPINWLAVVGGNHDAWSGHRDPLKHILKGRVPLYEKNAARIGFNHPNGQQTRLHARHNFKGNSQFSDLHGLRRESREGWRDHIIAAGHLHSGEDGAQHTGEGMISQMIRLSGYKRSDSFAQELGFKSKPMHPSALILIDPDKLETHRARVWCAPDIETGVDYLNFIAKRKAA